jgi:hypothetical protein
MFRNGGKKAANPELFQLYRSNRFDVVSRFLTTVIAGLDPAIHREKRHFLRSGWIRGSSPRMTFNLIERRFGERTSALCCW